MIDDSPLDLNNLDPNEFPEASKADKKAFSCLFEYLKHLDNCRLCDEHIKCPKGTDLYKKTVLHRP